MTYKVSVGDCAEFQMKLMCCALVLIGCDTVTLLNDSIPVSLESESSEGKHCDASLWFVHDLDFNRLLCVPTGKYVYQPMTPVEQLPSTEIPARPREPTNTIQISVSLTEHFLKFASVFQPPLPPDSPRYCMISDLFIDNYQVKCINGKMCYVQKQPAPHSHKTSPEEVSAHDALISRESSTPKIDHCSSPSSSEDSGINAVGAHYVESCDEDTEEGAELSSEEDYSPESSWEPDECTLLSPSQSDLEVIETIETTV